MEKAKVLRSAGVVGGLTLVSRFLGLARDVLMAGFFGASVSMSAFVVAFTIPNLFRRLFGEGALSSAFVPVFVESRKKEGDAAAWVLARKVATLAGTVLLILVLLGTALCTLLLARPEWVSAISRAVGRPELEDMLALVLPLLRVMLPYMLFICLAALSMATLNSFHHFAVPAATPALLNIVWIATVVLVCPRLGTSQDVQIYGVAWAVVFAGVLQLAVQFPMLRRFGFHAGLSFDWRDKRVGRVITLMGPVALGMAVTQFNVVIDRLLAAWVGPAAPAALFYSERLIYFPLGIFATALGTVLLPVLSGHAADDSAAEARDTIHHSLRALLFVTIPASVGLLVLAAPIVQMIFEWRNFSAADTDYTRIALQFYAPGLVIFSLAKVFVPAFYAHQDTRTPVRVGIMAVGLNLALNITFVLTWPQELKHAGLACATVLAEAFYAIMLAVLLHRRYGSPGWRGAGASAARSLVAAGAMGVVVGLLHAPLFARLLAAGLLPKFAQVIAVVATIAAGLLVYAAGSALMRSPEMLGLWRAVRRRG